MLGDMASVYRLLSEMAKKSSMSEKIVTVFLQVYIKIKVKFSHALQTYRGM
jgi:hypothetical protein